MNYHITLGTDDYLKEVMDKYENEDGHFYLLEHSGDAALVHRTSGDDVFESGQSFEPMEETGSFDGARFVVFNNIPVSYEHREIFEDRFKQRASLVENEPGCEGVTILRPKDSDTYIVISLWKDERDFEAWRGSSSYEKAHSNRNTADGLPQSVFNSKPYLRSYNVIAST